jgi:hypothetical protein
MNNLQRAGLAPSVEYDGRDDALLLNDAAHRMPFVFCDGGRAAAGYRGKTGDCTCRAIAIATGRDYQTVCSEINLLAQTERLTKRRAKRSRACTGVHKPTTRRYLLSLGWRWVPTMFIGQGCKVHLRTGELPNGTLIVAVSHHLVAVLDGTIYDTHDCSRGGTRCVYGYFVYDDGQQSSVSSAEDRGMPP